MVRLAGNVDDGSGEMIGTIPELSLAVTALEQSTGTVAAPSDVLNVALDGHVDFGFSISVVQKDDRN